MSPSSVRGDVPGSGCSSGANLKLKTQSAQRQHRRSVPYCFWHCTLHTKRWNLALLTTSFTGEPITDSSDPTGSRFSPPEGEYQGLVAESELNLLSFAKMAAALVVISKVGSKCRPKRIFVNRNDVVETLPTDRANQALHKWGLPGGSRGRKDFCDSPNPKGSV
jgi:hypothetical protein